MYAVAFTVAIAVAGSTFSSAIIFNALPMFPSLIRYGNLSCFIHNVALIVVERMHPKDSESCLPNAWNKLHVNNKQNHYYCYCYYFVMKIPLLIRIMRMFSLWLRGIFERDTEKLWKVWWTLNNEYVYKTLE